MFFKRFRIIRAARRIGGWQRRFSWMVTGLSIFTLFLILLFEGYRLSFTGVERYIVRFFSILTALATLSDILIFLLFPPSEKGLSKIGVGTLIFFGVLIVVSLVIRRFITPVWIVYQLFTSRRRFSGLQIGVRIGENLRRYPVRMLIMSFLILIGIGTLLLTLPGATADNRGADFLTALFTATSATCVTGLIVKDTPVYFSRFGQVVILFLIQFGGLGIMTFYTSLAVIFGRRLGLAERRTMEEIVEETREIDITRTIRYILIFTLLAEGIGGVILFFRWLFTLRSLGEALFYSLFHSVSAFCNAGFSLFSNSLTQFRSDILINFCFISLIVFGGLGFPVVHELFNRTTLRRPLRFTLRRLTLHTRLVLWTTAILIISGALLFFFFEFDNTLMPLPVGSKLLASLFQSVTARTAGFNTLSIERMKPITLFLLIILMFIGASPAGTGGGIKTSTIAVLFIAIRSAFRGEEEIQVFRWRIPREVVYRAIGIFILGLCGVIICFGVLLVSHTGPSFSFEALLFEVVSAFGTVGLSTGITPNLNTVGKLAIIILMYVGRIGPLTLALAMTGPKKKLRILYPTTRVLVG